MKLLEGLWPAKTAFGQTAASVSVFASAGKSPKEAS